MKIVSIKLTKLYRKANSLFANNILAVLIIAILLIFGSAALAMATVSNRTAKPSTSNTGSNNAASPPETTQANSSKSAAQQTLTSPTASSSASSVSKSPTPQLEPSFKAPECTKTSIPYKLVSISADLQLNMDQTDVEGGVNGYKESCINSDGSTRSYPDVPPVDEYIYVGTQGVVPGEVGPDLGTAENYQGVEDMITADCAKQKSVNQNDEAYKLCVTTQETYNRIPENLRQYP